MTEYRDISGFPGYRALPVCLYPWFENPYGLVSWWDMRQFAGDHLHSALAILGKIECDMVHYRAPGDPGAAIFMGSVVVPVDERGKIEEALRFVESAFKAIGLHTTPVAVCELRTTLINYKMTEYARIGPADLAARLQEIQRTCRREMSTSLFLYVDPKDADFYRKPLDGWEMVVQRWYKTEGDIIESSKSFALGRYAASIFHIMNVAELGVIQVGNLLNISGDKPGWGCVQRLERILDKPFNTRDVLEQQHSDLLKRIVPMIVAVKDSVRHKIDHVDNKLIWLDASFSREIANEVMLSTRGFMRRLSIDLP